MKRAGAPRARAFLSALVGALALLATSATVSGASERLRVFAAASLGDAIEEIGRVFARGDSTLPVLLNLAGSQQLVAQLREGAAADLFAAADSASMALAIAAGRIDGPPRTFAFNRLVIIVPVPNAARVVSLADLARPGVKLVLGAESVPIGAYSRRLLSLLARRPGFGESFAAGVLANVVSQEENVKGVLSKVVLGEADAGIVYRSDVTPRNSAQLALLEIPEDANVRASYPIAVVAGALQAAHARRFVELVLSDEGQGILERHGFAPVDPEP